MTDQLSPAAQAVMIAATNGNFNVVNDPVYRQCIAAALRAAAEKCKLGPEHWEGSFPNEYEKGWNAALDYIMKIATELEGRHD